MLSSQTNISFLSFHPPIFHPKINRRHGNLLKGGTCKTNRDEHRRDGGQNLKISNGRTF